MGNRGCLHDDTGTIRRRHAGKAWITCTLREKPGSGPVPQAAAGRYTPLFFLDEAVACAAGHRPCAECRREAYDGFRAAWARAFGTPATAVEMDAILHAARYDRATRGPRRHRAQAHALPAGAFLLWSDRPHLVTEGGLRPYTGEGYGPALPLPDAEVTVLTPEPMVAVMRAGWRPLLDPAQDRPRW
jgi:hypothetical protein